jgi:hypothetical protein
VYILRAKKVLGVPFGRLYGFLFSLTQNISSTHKLIAKIMSSEEQAVSLWNETNLVLSLHHLLELSVQAEFAIVEAIGNFENSNIKIAEFIFQVTPSITRRDQSKLILYNF